MRIGNEEANNGHAVLLVGYQDSRDTPGGGYFIVRNSWGTGWGQSCPYGPGYGTIPYQYIANDAWEACSAVAPGVSAAAADAGADTDGSLKDSKVQIHVGANVVITVESKS
jgi:C1A family cysteine protease